MKNVVDYLLKSDLAEIPKRGRTELKSIVIDGKKFRYNKDKPISKKLERKLKSIKKTNEYRSYAHNKLSLNIRMKQALTKYAIKKQIQS